MSTKYLFTAFEAKTGHPLTKLILLNLCDRANDEGKSWPSINRIAKDCECSRRSVINQLNKLVEMGILKKVRRSANNRNIPNIYTVQLKAVVKLEAPLGGESAAPVIVHELHLDSASAAPTVVHELHPGSAPPAPKSITEPIIKPITRKGTNIPPSIEDVQQYIQDKGYRIDPYSFTSYYESNGWKVGKTKMVNWQAAVRGWQSRDNDNNNDFQVIGGR